MFTQTLSEVSLPSRRLESFLQLLSDFPGTNEDGTDPFLPHAHPIRPDKFLSDHNLKSAESFTGSEQLSSVSSGVSRRLGPGTGFMPHVVRRLIKMIGH